MDINLSSLQKQPDNFFSSQLTKQDPFILQYFYNFILIAKYSIGYLLRAFLTRNWMFSLQIKKLDPYFSS